MKLSHEHLQAIEDIKAKEKERGLVLNNFTPRMTGRQWWRRWESNPRPEMVQNDIYVRSLCFEIRLGLRPQTGSHQR